MRKCLRPLRVQGIHAAQFQGCKYYVTRFSCKLVTVLFIIKHTMYMCSTNSRYALNTNQPFKFNHLKRKIIGM